MLSAIYEGFLLGLVLAFSIGPAFFALINTGISHGFKSGATMAFGIFFSDVFFVTVTVLLIHFGMSDLLTDPQHQAFIGVIGGIVLVVYGAFHFHSSAKSNLPSNNDENVIKEKSPRASILFMKGFFLNMFNPFVWIFWISTTTIVSTKYEFHIYRVILFFACALGMVISTDLLKTFIAGEIKSRLTSPMMTKVRYFSGSMLILFGLYLIYKVFFLHR